MNPLHPDHMTSAERRAELCALLALAIIRLHQRQRDALFSKSGENCLNLSGDQCRHESAANRKIAA